jgi:drug/metabolite transporter (DMT)-like permease
VEKTWQLYINGRWVGAQHGKTFAVVNPATQDVIAQVPDGGPAEAHAAVEAAAGAFLCWSQLPGMERGRLLTKTAQLMLERCDDLARLVTQENGKPFEEARKEVAFATGYFRWFAEEARRVYGAIVPAPVPHKRLWVLKQPLGVVAAITPWNFPVTMVTRKIAPALAAGCPVVLKPASATPLTALALAEILHEAGLLLGLATLFTTQLGLLNVGTWLSTAGHAAVLVNSYPVHIVLVAHYFVPGDRLTPARLGGVLLGYGGTLLLFADQLLTLRLAEPRILAGDVILALSALLLGIRHVVLNRQLQFIHPVKPLLAQVILGTPLFVVLSAAFEPQVFHVTARLAGSLFYQGIVIAGFNFIALTWVLKHYRPSAVAAFSLTTPLFGVLATTVVLDEPITWTLGASAVLVAGGIALASLGRAPAPVTGAPRPATPGPSR